MAKRKKKIAIIDYQLSNLFSVKHVCEHIGLDAKITSNPADVINADAAILPGVGSFGDAMNNLKKFKLIDPIKSLIDSGKPFMGVCLGLQLLFGESNEFGRHRGLGLIPGIVRKFPSVINNNKIKIPQIGWNKVYRTNISDKLWKLSPMNKIKNNEFMYFVHSYFVIPNNKDVILSLTNYEGVEYCSGVGIDNIFAIQFHPEKSGAHGVKIYKEWSKTIK